MAHLKSLISNAIPKEKYLPKAIVLVTDDDIIKQSKLTKKDAEDGEFKLIMKYLLEEINREVTKYWDNLLTKAHREFYPHIVWILPPAHKYMANNVMREHFNQAVEEEVSN